MKLFFIFSLLILICGCGGVNGKPLNSGGESETPLSKEASVGQGTTCKNLEPLKGTHSEIAVQMNRIRIKCKLSTQDAEIFAARY